VKTIILMILTFSPLCLFAMDEKETPWRLRHAEGWAWYHDFKKSKEPKELKKQEEPPKSPAIALKEAREELENSLAAAMIKPNKENILAYMALQKKWVDQASLFSQLWVVNLLEHPEFASLSPTTQYGVQVKKGEDSKLKKSLIGSLAKGTSLLFFYEGKDAFSKAFSNVVSEFSKMNEWEVKAIAMDGYVLKDFPNSIRDPFIAREMKVNIFPSLFVIEETTLKAIPIAFGMATISQIEENIVVQFKGNL
jgi:conjugal transfer pilus assembly protein TraF